MASRTSKSALHQRSYHVWVCAGLTALVHNSAKLLQNKNLSKKVSLRSSFHYLKRAEMSFGFSVGDFITISALAMNIYSSCKNSSRGFKSITNEVNSLHIVLKKTSEYLSDHSLDTDTANCLESLKNECYSVLKDIQDLLQKHRSLGTKGRIWDKMKWGSEDVSGIRHRLTVNVTLLTAFNTTITK